MSVFGKNSSVFGQRPDIQGLQPTLGRPTRSQPQLEPKPRPKGPGVVDPFLPPPTEERCWLEGDMSLPIELAAGACHPCNVAAIHANSATCVWDFVCEDCETIVDGPPDESPSGPWWPGGPWL